MFEQEPDIEGFLAEHGSFERPAMLECGEMVGDWRVTAFLGRGATSEVYRAENAVTRQIGAVKILTRDDDKARERFRREISILADVVCAAFPRFYGAGEYKGRQFLVTEILEPAELPSSDSAVARFVLGVCVGVEALHCRGYVHRDIKPRNIMIRPSSGEPVLIDMGLAKDTEESSQTVSDTISVVGGQAVGVGTIGYSAPEQFSGGRIGAAADVHALGMLVNACFKSRPPRAWADIVRRSTSSAPEQRYATVAAFVRAVRRRHLSGLAVATLIVASLAVFTAFLLKDRFTVSEQRSPVIIEQTLPVVHQQENPVISETNPPTPVASQVVDKPEAPLTTEAVVEALQDAAKGSSHPALKPKEEKTVKVEKGSAPPLKEPERKVDAKTKTIKLDGRDIKMDGETVLRRGQKIVVVGPGRLTASISGERGASVELKKNATLINLTTKPYPESAMKYVVSGTSYLNFKNLQSPPSGDVGNVWVDDLGGDGKMPIIRYGGPDTYEAARKTISVFL